MVAWFAGIFYLPRLFVNLAMSDDPAVKNQLLIMAKKLYRFITPWMVLTLIFGFWLLSDDIGATYLTMGWLKLKIALVLALVVYHFYCGKIIRTFTTGINQRSHVWFRWFNEFPVIILFAVILLAVAKPF